MSTLVVGPAMHQCEKKVGPKLVSLIMMMSGRAAAVEHGGGAIGCARAHDAAVLCRCVGRHALQDQWAGL